jgi:hypothetical protein
MGVDVRGPRLRADHAGPGFWPHAIRRIRRSGATPSNPSGTLSTGSASCLQPTP